MSDFYFGRMIRLVGVAVVTLICILHAWSGQGEVYNPLQIDGEKKIKTLDLTVVDSARKREIPVRVYFPWESKASPVVLFSHGLGGSRENSPYLGNHWAARGYLVVFMQHEGSDESVWKGQPVSDRMRDMKKAASAKNLLLRAKDVSVVMDQLASWNKTEGNPLFQKMDLSKIGMTGHSFGAVTTQTVSGEKFPVGPSFTDERIKAAMAMSPSVSEKMNASRALGSVKIPWMLMTGTKDEVSFLGSTVESRLAVFPALPPGSKYEVVLWNAEHSAFGDRPLAGGDSGRNPNHHRVILGLSTAFWDAYLKVDSQAREWLDGTGPSTLLEKEDRWQKK